MNKKQKKMLIRILLAAALIDPIEFCAGDRIWEISVVSDPLSDYRI